MARYHVGIDVGKARHHACVRDTQKDTYSQVFPFSVDRRGFQGLLAFLESQGPQASKEELLVGVEASGPYALTISTFLLEGGYQVVELNPCQASPQSRLGASQFRLACPDPSPEGEGRRDGGELEWGWILMQESMRR